jgi:hypothetical protein
LPYGHAAPSLRPGDEVLLSIRPEMLAVAGGRIEAEIEEVVFGGAATRLLLRAVAAPDVKLDVQFTADARAAVPFPGDRITLDYDPANAVVVPVS